MSLASTYGPGKFGLSFELFPPKTAKGQSLVIAHLELLMACKPDFVTCTYGAGGSTREKTLDIISRIKSHFNVPVAAHLTCVGATVDQLREQLEKTARIGVDCIVALRGDPPRGETEFKIPEVGLAYANDLVTLIRNELPQFDVFVAGYPETHQEAPSPEVDLENLKRKVDAGADAVITQVFYRNEDFLRFRERYEAAGISVPLVPGILPVNSLAQARKVTAFCGASLPKELTERMALYDDPDWQYQVGVEFATQQVRDLVQHGVPGMHFYVLNKSPATLAVLKAAEQI
ncbi:MAG: methylenetetrahydrofolate reductase [NAD(P)H] [Planctomycetota bacterium]